MQEIWKDIVGFEGLYQVSNLGRIKSLDRVIVCSNLVRRNKKGRILVTPIEPNGYKNINIKIGYISKRYYIHRLVATHFIPNKLNKPCVNHINGNKQDNRVNNLEWVTYKENTQHAHRTGLFNKEKELRKLELMHNALKKPIKQISNGIVIATYESSAIAGKQFSRTACMNISACARGKIKSAYGFQWEYIN